MATSFFCGSQAVNYIEISFLNEKLKTCSLSASDAESVDPMSALHAVTSACPGVKPTRQTNINQQRVVCFGGAVKTIPMEMGQGQKTKSLARWCWQATSQVRCLKKLVMSVVQLAVWPPSVRGHRISLHVLQGCVSICSRRLWHRTKYRPRTSDSGPHIFAIRQEAPMRCFIIVPS